jgi:hypothetical protein
MNPCGYAHNLNSTTNGPAVPRQSIFDSAFTTAMLSMPSGRASVSVLATARNPLQAPINT